MTHATDSIERKILECMATFDTGLSSMCMAFTALKLEGGFPDHPLDPGDFNRCLILVECVPEIREHFQRIAKLSIQWSQVVSHWDELEKLFAGEVGRNWSSGSKAEKTYARMKELGL